MTAPNKLNPLVCDTLADTAYLAACALKYLARAAEDRADMVRGEPTRSNDTNRKEVLTWHHLDTRRGPLGSAGV